MQSTIVLKISCLLLRKRMTLHNFRDLFSASIKKKIWKNRQVYKYAHTFHIWICFSNHLYKPFRLHMALINNPFTNNILSSEKKKEKNPNPFHIQPNSSSVHFQPPAPWSIITSVLIFHGLVLNNKWKRKWLKKLILSLTMSKAQERAHKRQLRTVWPL